jgi:pimeloyl-ACP methyl ester carboxylesterase
MPSMPLGDAGMSVQVRPIRDAADQADWLDQALAQLPVRSVHLVGHSFGGWLAATYVVRHPELVQTLTLPSAAALSTRPIPSPG